MSRKTNLSNRASQALIAADARLFRNLAMNSRLEPIRSSAFLALLPFLSAFAYESANYISRTDPGATRMLLPHEERRIASRMRLKLTEDKYKSSARVLENVEELIAINSGWFLDHGGILGPVKRLLQPDVGICFMKNEAVYTTHIAFLGMGLSKDDLARSSISRETLGRQVYDRSYDIGQYVGPLLRRLNVENYKPENSPEVPLPVVRSRHGVESLVRGGEPSSSEPALRRCTANLDVVAHQHRSHRRPVGCGTERSRRAKVQVREPVPNGVGTSEAFR
jgi:hypothetical protein